MAWIELFESVKIVNVLELLLLIILRASRIAMSSTENTEVSALSLWTIFRSPEIVADPTLSPSLEPSVKIH